MPINELLLQHATRYWEAECENAARHGARANMTMTALGALLGLGLFKIEWFRNQTDALSVVNLYDCRTIKVLLVGGLLFFAFALLLTMRTSRFSFWVLFKKLFAGFSPKEDDDDIYGCASRELRFKFSEIKVLPKMDEGKAMALVFAKVYRAAEELRLRNVVRAKHQQRANLFFSIGLIFVAMAVVCYIMGS